MKSKRKEKDIFDRIELLCSLITSQGGTVEINGKESLRTYKIHALKHDYYFVVIKLKCDEWKISDDERKVSPAILKAEKLLREGRMKKYGYCSLLIQFRVSGKYYEFPLDEISYAINRATHEENYCMKPNHGNIWYDSLVR